MLPEIDVDDLPCNDSKMLSILSFAKYFFEHKL